MVKQRPKILEANYMFMVVAILLIATSLLIKFTSLYKQIAVTHYLVISLPILAFLIIKRYDLKSVLRLDKITFKQAMLSVLIPIFSYPIGLFFNYISMIIISLFGELQASPIPIPETTGMFFLGLVMFAITPGITEEIMFRGLILSAYERVGMKKAIVLTGLMFGLFHFDVQNFLGPAFLGILFAYMVYKTNSIYTSMIAHAVNNSIALIILKFAGSLEAGQDILQAPDLPEMPTTQVLLVGFVVITMMAVTASLIVYFLLKALRNSGKDNKQIEEREKNVLGEKITFLHILPIIVVVIIFIISAVLYFKMITGS